EHALEALAGERLALRRQLGADDRSARMDLAARVAGDEADDPLDLRGPEPDAGVAAPLPQPVEPQRTVGVDHDLDDRRIVERRRDRRPHGAAQHRALPPEGARPTHRRDSGASETSPLASCRPTRSTNAAKRSRPSARAVSSPSATGGFTVSMYRTKSA